MANIEEAIEEADWDYELQTVGCGWHFLNAPFC